MGWSVALAVVLLLATVILTVRWYRHPSVPLSPQEQYFRDTIEAQANMDKVLVTYLMRQVTTELEDPDRLRATYGAVFADADMRQKLDLIINIAARHLDCPIAAFTVVFNDRQQYLAAKGIDVESVKPLEASYCRFIVGTKQPLAVEDSLTHELVCVNESTLGDGLRAYLGVPFINKKGYILGALCVADYKPRTWTVDDVQLLTELCSLAVASDTKGEL